MVFPSSFSKMNFMSCSCAVGSPFGKFFWYTIEFITPWLSIDCLLLWKIVQLMVNQKSFPYSLMPHAMTICCNYVRQSICLRCDGILWRTKLQHVVTVCGITEYRQTDAIFCEYFILFYFILKCFSIWEHTVIPVVFVWNLRTLVSSW